jgi:hypothetical protein
MGNAGDERCDVGEDLTSFGHMGQFYLCVLMVILNQTTLGDFRSGSNYSIARIPCRGHFTCSEMSGIRLVITISFTTTCVCSSSKPT